VRQFTTCDIPDYSTSQLGDISPPANGSFLTDIQAMSINTFIVAYKQQTNVSAGINSLPVSYNLSQNYPNPFNPLTTINYSVPKSEFVKIKVFDLLGREVITLVNEYKPVGNYTVQFNANKLSSGVYFYRMESGFYSQTKKLILLK
jgi:hypothetical protein